VHQGAECRQQRAPEWLLARQLIAHVRRNESDPLILRPPDRPAARGVRRLAGRLHEDLLGTQAGILAFESERMTIPKAKFIGLSSADPDRYGLRRKAGVKLNGKDIGRAKELRK
jgi:hypothetical protein